MKGKRFSREFIDSIIKEVSETKNVPSVALKHGIPNSTIHTWIRKNNNPVNFREKKSSREIEAINENNKLKKLLAEKEAENLIMRDLLKKTYQVWPIN